MARVRIATYEYVIARFDVDGFRIDTLRYLRGGMPRLFGNAMGEFSASIGKKNFFTCGEVWSSEEDIARFIGRNTQEGTDLVGVDAALDYPLFDVLKPLSKGLPKSQGGASPTDLAAIYQKRKTVEQHIISSHGDATRFFVTFVDNHDVKERIRYVDPAQPHRYDDQVSLAISA